MSNPRFINIQYATIANISFVLGSYNHHVCLLDFQYRSMRNQLDNKIQDTLQAQFVEQGNGLLQQTHQQLEQFLNGDRKQLELPVRPVGSEFEQAVWVALQAIPYGETTTYKQLAERIQSQFNDEVTDNAVAQANGANSLALIVPCHRVLADDGALMGYGGGLALKKKLLHLERIHSHATTKVQLPLL